MAPPGSSDQRLGVLRAPGAARGIDVDILDDTRSVARRELTLLRDRLATLGTLLDSPARSHSGVTGELRIRLVGDAAMSRAHATHLGDDTTTDVITFDLADGESALTGVLDVDVLVCVDEARRQAALRGIDVARELLLYGVHAVLHCLGYDDHTDDDARAMHAKEDELLEALGVGATFGLHARGLSVASDTQPPADTGHTPSPNAGADGERS